MIPATMRGVQLVGHGGPEKLVWNDSIPTPSPGAGEVLVRVRAAGVNNTDINTRVGWYAKNADDPEDGGWSGAIGFPRIQGADICGEVVAVGDGVAGFAPGMRVTCPTNQPLPTAAEPVKCVVIGSEFDGGFAQYCVVPARNLYDVVASPLSDGEIGAMPCAHGTAFNMLSRASVGDGDRVLITGASGGVGLAAVQLAKILGAHVTAIAGRAKHEEVREAGADVLMDRGETPPAGTFTVVIDVVGGDGWGALIEAIAHGGRYAVAGAVAGPMVEADLRTIYLGDITIFGCTYQSPEVFAGLVALINQGAVRPLVSKTYPLAEIATAQADFASKKYPGKLVLIPPQD